MLATGAFLDFLNTQRGHVGVLERAGAPCPETCHCSLVLRSHFGSMGVQVKAVQRYALSLLLSAWVTAVSAAQTEISPLVAGQTLAQDQNLCSPEGTVCLVAQGDGNLVLYNETLVAMMGPSALSAIYATGTYTASANGHPAPYTLSMQRDCNLVLYDGNAPSNGFSAATAVYNSGTYGQGATTPCSLIVSSTAGGFFAVVDGKGAVLFQQPALPPPPSPTPPPCTCPSVSSCATTSTPAPSTTAPPPTTVAPPTSTGPPALRGNILAAGGINGGTAVANLAEVYNPTMGTWSATGSLTAARYNFQMVLLNNFNVLAAGGQTPARPQLVDAEVYSPSTGTWTATGSLSAGRHDFQMVLLRNGNVLAAGGFGNGIFLDSAEVYSPTNGTWSATGSFPGGGANAREFFGMVLLPSGNVLAAGGSNQGGIVASALVYSPTMGTWTATGSLATARYGFQMLLLPNGNVLAAGGANNGGSAGLLASAELYNATTGTWSPTGSLLSGRLNFQMVLLSNGNVLAAGGETIGGAAALASAEVYSPTTGTWTPTGSLASARYSFQMALLPNGNVLAASGYNGSDYLTSAEVYSPMTSTWTATGSLANPRSFFQMAGF